MELKGAELRNLTKLCLPMPQNGCDKMPLNVCIPYYQRPYKWDEQKIKNLFVDYFKNAESEKPEEAEEYFVGSVVMVEKKNSVFEIIDGQQRITTLFLLNYIKFIFLRAYIEELLIGKKFLRIDSLMTDMEETALNLFDSQKINKMKEVHEQIGDMLEIAGEEENLQKKEQIYENAVKMFQEALGLPEKNLSDRKKYCSEYSSKLGDYLSDCKFALTYKRSSYNEKMLEALKRCMIELSNSENPELHIAEESTDQVISQYTNALCYEFQALKENCGIEPINVTPLNYAKMLIEAIDKMLLNISLCAVVTTSEKDAYTLFEVLNDRSMTIEDLDLTKNLLFKWYCNHTDENEVTKDKNIEKADKLWVEDIFSAMSRKEEAKLISFLTAEYLTADESQKFKDTARYRESIEKNYLEEKQRYDGADLLNDIKIYQMIATILREMEFCYQKKAEKVVETEAKGQKSIVYRSLNLLHALKQYGVMPAIVNIILNKYIESNTEKEYDITKFEAYVRILKDDADHSRIEYKEIYELSYDLWKYVLLAKDYDIPRTFAKQYIKRNYAAQSDVEYRPVVSADEVKNELKKWLYDWKYGSGDQQLKAKVLFINLFEMVKDQKTLKLAATRTKFATADIQLDHMEAKNPIAAASEKYFEPSNTNETRESYIDGIGNFMIMDRKDNNNKNNLPLQDALKFYDAMAPNHWMVMEVKELLQDEHFSNRVVIMNELYQVPNEEFFKERKARLFSYFYAMLQRGLGDTEVTISE